MTDAERYIFQRGEWWFYRRNVPKDLHQIDGRAPVVKIALKTKNIHEARHERDKLERANVAMWRALRAGMDAKSARQAYEAQLDLQMALDWPVRPQQTNILLATKEERLAQIERLIQGAEIATGMTVEEAIEKKVPMVTKVSPVIRNAVYGLVPVPMASVTVAFEEYCRDELANAHREKSEAQRIKWRKPKQIAVNMFCDVVDDVALLEITRQQAKKFHSHLLARINRGEIGDNMASRMLGSMRVLFQTYARALGEDERVNPFRDLAFAKPRGKNKRVEFSIEWLSEKFLQGEGLKGLNVEAKRALLTLIETGCRPSEVVNLLPENIKLQSNVPHLQIRHRPGRELKTDASERDIPLVGIALEAMRLQPDGFPRYRDREESFSAVCMKYLRENDLKESPASKVYSIRHSFETRMKSAKLDLEMRLDIFGHANERQEYGSGFSLAAKHEALAAMALPFDSEILKGEEAKPQKPRPVRKPRRAA